MEEYVGKHYDEEIIDGYKFYSNGDSETEFDGYITTFMEIPLSHPFYGKQLKEMFGGSVVKEILPGVYSWQQYYCYYSLSKRRQILQYFKDKEN